MENSGNLQIKSQELEQMSDVSFKHNITVETTDIVCFKIIIFVWYYGGCNIFCFILGRERFLKKNKKHCPLLLKFDLTLV